jgi:hypothetical protein
MQTSIWMTYSDSTHFFEQFSYKILFISTYQLKDINFARYTHVQQFPENRERLGIFSPRVN